MGRERRNAELIRTGSRRSGITAREMGKLRVERAGILIHEIRRGVGERMSWGWKGSDCREEKERAETGSRTEE